MTRTGVAPGAPGIVLGDLEEDERPFHFLSGRLCLALVTTVGERWRRNFERLVTPADLDRWIVEAGLAAGEPATEADLAEARQLRDALHVLACAVEDGRTLPPSATAVVNRAAADPALVPVLTADGRSWDATEARAEAALSTVARDAIDLFSSPERDGVRHCGADDCALVFLDTSRGRRRRWCSMTGCGNRAKQRAHRDRTNPSGLPSGP